MKTRAEAFAYLLVHGQAISEAAIAGDEKARQIVHLYLKVYIRPNAPEVGLLIAALNEWQQRQAQPEGQG